MDNHPPRLGLFKIVNETSVAAGVRRIEGVLTGMGVMRMLDDALKNLQDTAQA